MSSYLEVIRVYSSIEINSDLINATKSEYNNLDLNTTALFKRFPPGKNYIKVIDSLKK